MNTPLGTSPDSLSAVLKITLYRDGQKKNVTCVASLIPRKRIKLEFKGILNKHLADFYWVQDSLWSLTIPSEDLFYQGDPDSVSLPVFDIEELALGPFLDYLWDGLHVRKSWKAQSKKKGHYFLNDSTGILYSVSPKTERVQSAKKKDHLILYKGLMTGISRAVPEKIIIQRGSEKRMQIRVEKIRDNPRWKKSPFFIKIPEGQLPMSPSEVPQ